MERNKKAVQTMAKAAAWMVYIIAVIFGDIMYLMTVQSAFPEGFLRFMAYLGAFSVGLSACIIPLALHHWFSPGKQYIAGIIFWLLDAAVLALNTILAYQQSIGAIDDTLYIWGALSPATPLLAVLGWGFIFLLDEDQRAEQAKRAVGAELQDAFNKALAEEINSADAQGLIQESARIYIGRAADQFYSKAMEVPVLTAKVTDVAPSRQYALSATDAVEEQPQPAAKPKTKPKN